MNTLIKTSYGEDADEIVDEDILCSPWMLLKGWMRFEVTS